MEYDKPLPRPEGLLKPFWDAVREDRLVMQTCDECGDQHFPPTPVCPHCLNGSQHWVQVSGKGKLESWIDFHYAYWAGFRNSLPYRACLVRLAESPLLISNLVGSVGEPAAGCGRARRLRSCDERYSPA